ncbi:MAG TPA: DNA methyltransferase [Burkholderiaceae bacterium]|nr:DNA methyltransferase [Burkholderiaceae bacterium]HQR75692.1 DNA methyltransferase [Burkholderiaceae bacterium]
MIARPFARPLALAAACLLTAAFVADANARDRKDCERDYKPQVGQSGKDVVWVPTPDELVQRMLRMAKVTPQDLVYDLGAGDGKIAIAAGKLGANSVGIEYNPDMAKLANCLVTAEGVASKTKIIQGDIFKEDFSKATVITMYLLPELNLCVRHRILAMKPGTRVTSHQFTMGDWEADETSEFEYRTAYLWIVPARVDGIWALRDASGANTTINLTQTFQKLSGEVMSGASRQPLVGATLRGDQLRFAFNDDKGVTRTFSGTVRGNELAGTFKSGNAETKVTGAPQGALRAAPWAEMLAQCGRFYGK